MLPGNGEFGEVYLAQAKHVPGAKEGSDTVVMVKALQHTRDETSLQEFKRQLDMFSRLDHAHITRLIGLCNDVEPHYMVLQYTDWVSRGRKDLLQRFGKRTMANVWFR